MASLDKLKGKRISKILWSDDHLQFETDMGSVAYTVYGECCSTSYFHDILGVANLLRGGKVTKFEEVPLNELEEKKEREEAESTQFYGYRITVEDEKLGELTAVLSFRNESNGYYGGSMGGTEPLQDVSKLKELTTDYLGD